MTQRAQPKARGPRPCVTGCCQHRRGVRRQVWPPPALLDYGHRPTTKSWHSFELTDQFGVDRERFTEALEACAAGERHACAVCRHAAEPRRQELFRRLNLAPAAPAAGAHARGSAGLLADDPALGRSTWISTTCSRRGSTAAFWYCGASTGRRPPTSSKRSSSTRRCTRSTAGTICAAGCSRPTGAALPSSTRPRRRAADFRRGRADQGHPGLGARPCSAEDRALLGPKADTAVFYSISNCQEGLRGVSFGNFLIKQVVAELRRGSARPQDLRHAVARPRLLAWLRKARQSDRRHNLSGSTCKPLMTPDNIARHRRNRRAEARWQRGTSWSHAQGRSHRSGRALSPWQWRAA